MRDVNDPRSLCPQVPNDLEEFFDFGLTQGCRRFIKDNHLGVCRNRLGNFHHLLLADRQVSDLGSGFDVYVQLLKERRRILFHLSVIDKEAVHPLLPDKKILCDRQVIHHIQFLVNDGDPRLFRLGNGFVFHLFSFELNGTLILCVDSR